MKVLEHGHPDIRVDHSADDLESEWYRSEDEDEERYPSWFKWAFKENILELECGYGGGVDRSEQRLRKKQLRHLMPVLEAWAHHQILLKQQEEVILSGMDEDALKYALARFPSLTRITITPATHGFLFTPLYETPMIRSFPYGFNYAIPRG